MTGEWSNHLWQSTLFAAAVWLLTLVCRKNRGEVRYRLWFAASIKFLVPFSLFVHAGSVIAPPRTVAGPATEPVAIPAAIAQLAQPFRPAGLPPREGRDWRPAAVVGIWAAGALSIALLRLRAWRRVQLAIRWSDPIGVRGDVELRSSLSLLEPGVVGWLRPVLLLPRGIADRLTPPQFEAIVAHELCHARRRDNLSAATHMLVETIFWFHPLVWWIGAHLLAERERACDEGVLLLGIEPREYALGILNVCKLYSESPLACLPGVTGSNLRGRVAAIAAGSVGKELSVWRKAGLAAAGIAAVTMPFAAGMLHPSRSFAQQAPPDALRFEVVSIKPVKECGGGRADSKSGGGGGVTSPGRLHTCGTLESFIGSAYILNESGHFDPSQRASMPPIEGVPGWGRSDRYQIDARAEGAPDRDYMLGPMLRRVLEDRFQLRTHWASREVPAYALAVARGGAKLGAFHEGSCTPRDPTRRSMPPAPGQNICAPGTIQPGKDGLRIFRGQALTIDYFARLLGWVVGRPVLNRTGIAGRYDFDFQFAPDESTPVLLRGENPEHPEERPADAAREPSGPTIFAALQQLGLRLESTRGPQRVLAVDRVERPSAN